MDNLKRKTQNNAAKELKAAQEICSTFYGSGGRVLLKKMSDYFECYGEGRHAKTIPAAGVVYGLLRGELDIVRVKDGKGFWHEEGYMPNETDGYTDLGNAI